MTTTMAEGTRRAMGGGCCSQREGYIWKWTSLWGGVGAVSGGGQGGGTGGRHRMAEAEAACVDGRTTHTRTASRRGGRTPVYRVEGTDGGRGGREGESNGPRDRWLGHPSIAVCATGRMDGRSYLQDVGEALVGEQEGVVREEGPGDRLQKVLAVVRVEQAVGVIGWVESTAPRRRPAHWSRASMDRPDHASTAATSLSISLLPGDEQLRDGLLPDARLVELVHRREELLEQRVRRLKHAGLRGDACGKGRERRARARVVKHPNTTFCPMCTSLPQQTQPPTHG